ncbi:MAG: hypothetical protein N3B01_08480, partial [Verrucomicrobiae bacterium]|nr:hypothetical protein [Verrucomicrobiae bacterium]
MRWSGTDAWGGAVRLTGLLRGCLGGIFRVFVGAAGLTPTVSARKRAKSIIAAGLVGISSFFLPRQSGADYI